MHIEPGMLNAAKILSANAAAIATLAVHAPALVKKPLEIVKFLLAAVFFSLFMQSFHMPVGPSELHFIGASFIYFTFGFLPTLFGFAFGLLMQGLAFEPADLVHLGVNSLSLMVPLIAVHATFGRHFFAEGAEKAKISIARVLRFDASYHAGVVSMVGFWLFLGEDATALADWATFAVSYIPVVMIEPVITVVALRALDRLAAPGGALRQVTTIDRLALAA